MLASRITVKHPVKAAIGPKTKMILLNNPGNPTGMLIRDWQPYIDMAREHDLWIVADEIYRGIGELVPSISDVYEKGISTSSMSKIFGVPGLRLGWAKGPADLIRLLDLRRDYTVISTGPLTDRLACAVLAHKDELLEKNSARVQENREILRQFLREYPAFSCVIPAAGLTAFMKFPEGMDTQAACVRLLKEAGVFYVPGECFGRAGYVRLGLGQDPEKFIKGLHLTANL